MRGEGRDGGGGGGREGGEGERRGGGGMGLGHLGYHGNDILYGLIHMG